MIILSKYNLFNFPNNGHDRVCENFCRLRQTFRKTKNMFIVKMGLDGRGWGVGVGVGLTADCIYRKVPHCCAHCSTLSLSLALFDAQSSLSLSLHALCFLITFTYPQTHLLSLCQPYLLNLGECVCLFLSSSIWYAKSVLSQLHAVSYPLY